jgi:hypothetical protein
MQGGHRWTLLSSGSVPRKHVCLFVPSGGGERSQQNVILDSGKNIINFFIILSGVRLSPCGTATSTGLLYQPQMIDDGDCGAIGGMKIGRGNRSTRRKPVPMPLCPLQIPHAQIRARTWVAAVGSRRLTARAMARPREEHSHRATAFPVVTPRS